MTPKTLDDYRAHLADARRLLEDTMGVMTPEQWEMPVQADGEQWTARQLIIHLSTAEPGLLVQMQRTVAGEQTIPDDFDLNRWNNSRVRKGADLTPADLQARLAENRAQVLAFMDTLSEADMGKEGRHPLFGMLTIAAYLQLIGDHELLHTGEIRAALGLG